MHFEMHLAKARYAQQSLMDHLASNFENNHTSKRDEAKKQPRPVVKTRHRYLAVVLLTNPG
jgi:hypothetical protein